VFCSYLVDTRLHRIGICGYEYGCDISYPRQPWLRARYALVADVRPSVSSSFVVRLVVIVILLYETLLKSWQRCFCRSIDFPADASMGRGDRTILGKARSTCHPLSIRVIDSPSASTQRTIGLDWHGGRANFLSQ